jgi:dihydropteroate synthase
MISIRPISIRTICEAADELKKIGLSSGEAERLAAETLCLHLKVEGVPENVIPFLKDMSRGLRVCVILPPTPPDPSGKHDLLLSGKASQMENLAATLDAESADLHRISLELRNLLKNMGKTRFAIPCRTRTLELGDKTLIMGTLNVTPDSFSDGGVFFRQDRALARALEMVEEGVDIIDIGGESTRPGARPIDPQEELSRILPVVKDLANQTDTPISVDTRRAEVARGVLEAGGQIINDISALRADPEMAKVIASHQVPVVLMHMRGTPETMQENIHYVSLVSDITQYLKQSIDMASMAGVDLERIIIDPGIGFGKTVDHNLAIIKHLYQFKTLGRPILVGPSRKSFIGKILDLDADQREEGTMASIAASILNGAHIVRVHNVRNAIRVSRIADAIKAVSIPEE